MKHRHGGGHNRHFENPEARHEASDERHPGETHRGHRHRGHHGGGRRGRLFDYGELRLVVLALIVEQPRHGYELMRAIEERMAGSYSPSPGVIYPTLAWLEDMGYAAVETDEAGRKRYQVTAEGNAFLAANRAAVDALFSRIGSAGKDGRYEGIPAPVIRGMENLKLALRLRLRGGPIDPAAAESIAAALDTAAQSIERS